MRVGCLRLCNLRQHRPLDGAGKGNGSKIGLALEWVRYLFLSLPLSTLLLCLAIQTTNASHHQTTLQQQTSCLRDPPPTLPLSYSSLFSSQPLTRSLSLSLSLSLLCLSNSLSSNRVNRVTSPSPSSSPPKQETLSAAEVMRMGIAKKWWLVVAVAVILILVMVEASSKPKICDKGWECKGVYCCNETITDLFQVYQFENLFAKRNTPVAHAVGFWDYHSFITAAALYEPIGFGTTGGKQMQMKEIAAFLGHVGSKTNCGYGVATGGPLAWGLCYNREMSPSQSYCKDDYLYPCTPGVEYYGRGAIPVYWNYNYGLIGDGMKVDLLNHPEYLEQNATLAFQAAMWRWMTPMKKKQPSAHDVFVGNWKPTKNDTLSNRLPGFGATMNVLYGDQICGQGFVDSMNNIMSHYQYYLDLVGVGREQSGDNLDCAQQVAFNPSSKSETS